MQPQQAFPIHEFGEFELDTLRRVLTSRATGQPVDITGRVVEALVYLVERPGQLVEKKALMDALWPHVVVEEGNLTQTIHSLRRALGEKAGEDRFIATVPGRGYRFVAAVKVRAPQVAVDAPPPRPLPRRGRVIAWSAVAAVLLVAIGLFIWRGDRPTAEKTNSAPPSIAVLAFVDMSPEQDQAHFAEGLSEEILNMLALADALRVIARTSSFSFRDQNADIHTIAQRLAVTHVLEGSVRKAGERVRITAQLIDGATSAHVWSDTYDRDLRDIFGVQSEIAAAVADALHVTMNRAAPTRAETSSTQAYEHYLQGRHLFHRRSTGDLLQAKSHFEKALEIDPEYGRAWTALAGVYMVARYEALTLPDAMPNWKNATERAVALSPELAEAHFRTAQYFWHAGDDATGAIHLARAKALNPQEPLVVSAEVSRFISEGRFDEAIELQKSLVALDPLSATNRGNLGVFLMTAGRFQEAQAELERSLELSPAAMNTLGDIAHVLILQGRADEAMPVISRMPEGYMREQRFALAHFARGDVAESDAILAGLIAEAEQRSADLEIAVAIAEVYAARNDKERAFAWLATAHRRAVSQPGFTARWWLYDLVQVAPFLKPLRDDPRWARLRPKSLAGK